MHGGSRVGVENHWSEAVLDDAALVEIRRVGAVRNDHRRHDGVGMMLEDGLAHGGLERRCGATDAGVRADVNDLDGHARIVDACLQFGDKFVGIHARQHAAIERRFTGGRDHVHLDWRSDAGRERRERNRIALDG